MKDKITLYAVHDVKSEHYDIPFFASNDINAKRRYLMLAEDNESMIGTFKDDFELCKLGDFEVETGKLIPDLQVVMTGKQIGKKEDK